MSKIVFEHPGLLGKVARYVNSRLKYQNANIAIGAALSFVSCLKSGRVSCQGIEPNIYCCVIAPSGTGKTQAHRAIESIIDESGLFHLIMGEPASDAGLIKALSDQPRRLLLWDELGIALSELSRASASHRALILSTIMKLFSASGTAYTGKQYAERERADVKTPFLSIFGASTPHRFFGSLNEDFVTDGFLSRWIILFAEVSNVLSTNQESIPADECRTFEEWESKEGDINSAFQQKEKIEIKISPFLVNFIEDTFQQSSAQSKSELERVFWSRASENCYKILCCLCDSLEASEQEAMQAIALAQSFVQIAIEKCREGLGTDHKQRAITEKVRAMVPAGQKIPLSIISKKCNHLGIRRNDRNQIIETLLESGEWAQEKVPVPNTFKKQTLYSRNFSI